MLARAPADPRSGTISCPAQGRFLPHTSSTSCRLDPSLPRSHRHPHLLPDWIGRPADCRPANGRVVAPQAEERLERGLGIAAPVVAEDELVEMGLEMRTADTVVRPDEPGLHVGDRPVREWDHLPGLGGVALDAPVVRVAERGEDGRIVNEGLWAAPLSKR